MPPIDINLATLSNFGDLPNLHDNAMGQELSESLTVTTLDLNFHICQHSSISKDKFLWKLKVVPHAESHLLEKNKIKKKKTQRETKEFTEHRKYRLIFISAHKTFYWKNNFNTL